MMDALNSKKLGNAAENKACLYLQKNGLKLIEKNYFCACGEIDLIMKDGEEIVFVEVRSRTKQEFADALETIDQHKQNKLIRAAVYYLQKKSLFDKVNCRFDVIGIHHEQLEWIKDAFSADNCGVF